MSTTALKEALKNCLINFERRVHLTDLLQQYKLSYADVDRTLKEHLEQQESKGVKFEKRFLVQGVDEQTKTQIFTVVNGEKKMRDWLKRLKEAEAALYSVEVLGGSLSPAEVFKPTEYHTFKPANLKVREKIAKSTAKLSNGNSTADAAAKTVKTEPKQEMKKVSAMEAFTKKPTKVEPSKSPKKESPTTVENKLSPKKEKPTPTKKTTPEEKKPKATAATNKKGINNFFAPVPAGAANKATETKKEQKATIQTTSPNKKQDFFKKQAEKPKAVATNKNKKDEEKPKPAIKKETKNKNKTADPNVSVQLFNADSDSEVDASSDEEEKLEALRRDIITADIEEEKPTSSSVAKRRRVISSDEEDDEPQQKVEKREENTTAAAEDAETIDITTSDEATSSQQQSETYMDDDGFLITLKPKKKGGAGAASTNSKKVNKTPVKKSPPARKSPLKTTAAASKAKAIAPAKTKQGNIMNFFSKK